MKAGETFKSYLGEGVYADFDGFAIALTTDEWAYRAPNNRIVLKPEMLKAFDTYRSMLKERILEPNEP